MWSIFKANAIKFKNTDFFDASAIKSFAELKTSKVLVVFTLTKAYQKEKTVCQFSTLTQ